METIQAFSYHEKKVTQLKPMYKYVQLTIDFVMYLFYNTYIFVFVSVYDIWDVHVCTYICTYVHSESGVREVTSIISRRYIEYIHMIHSYICTYEARNARNSGDH